MMFRFQIRMAEAMIQALKDDTAAQLQAIKEMNKASLKFTQAMKIDQEKGKYKDPASKRGVEFVMGCQFDLEELLGNLSPLFTSEGTLKAGLLEEKDSFINFVKDWGTLRERRNQEEREAYAIGNRSRHGWLTEKYYRSRFRLNFLLLGSPCLSFFLIQAGGYICRRRSRKTCSYCGGETHQVPSSRDPG